jgi:RNA polymerase sigma factor (sigma-70 family)
MRCYGVLSTDRIRSTSHVEVSALKYSGGIGLHARSPLLRLQSDERLVALVRRGNVTAFEVLVSRYESRLLSFCRHMLSCREDAEDVLQEVLAAAFNAMVADDRPINVRPWLYRIARNRSLNHLRRVPAVGVDSMDVHFSEHGASTADKVHEREEFRLLVGDIHELPETQKTALVLREMDALSYEQIAEAMETTVPSVKSLLVRARVSLAEAAEARLLSCDEVRLELGELAEGLRRRPSTLVRRHLRACERCCTFRVQLKETNRALAAVLPIGPLVLLKKLVLTHLGHSAGSSATHAGAAGSTAAAGSAAAGTTIVAGSTAGGFVSAGMGAIATKAAAGLAAAALVTAGAVEVDHSVGSRARNHSTASLGAAPAVAPASHTDSSWAGSRGVERRSRTLAPRKHHVHPVTPAAAVVAKPAAKPLVKPLVKAAMRQNVATKKTKPSPGRTQTQTDPTVLNPTQTRAPATATTVTTPVTPTTAPVIPAPTTTPPPATTTTPPPPPPTPPATTPPPTTPPPASGNPPPDARGAAPGTGHPGSSQPADPDPTPSTP